MTLFDSEVGFVYAGAVETPPNRWDESGGTVVVGSPYGGSVTVPFHLAMADLDRYEFGKPPARRLLRGRIGASGLYVSNNRQRLVQRFMDEERFAGAEWLLQVDSDIGFPPTLLETALERAASVDARILAINVPLGSHPTVAYNRTEIPGVFQNLYPLPPDLVFECDGVATAIMRTHRSVFEAIADEHGQSWFHHQYIPYKPEGWRRPRDTRFRIIGEDLAFCVRAQSVGVRVYVAHLVEGVRHYKTRPLSDTGALEEGPEAYERLRQAAVAAGVDPGETGGEIVHDGDAVGRAG